jgi:predicted MPP superfamily phosphohydrolase
MTRRRFLVGGSLVAGGLAVYGGEIERHWIEISHRDVSVPGLPRVFDGFRIAQLSDIHMDEYTEPFFLRNAVGHVNSLNPDAVFLTGDYVTHGFLPNKTSLGAAWQCANVLNQIQCPNRYAVLGNHDVLVGSKDVSTALTANGITVLINNHLPIERAGARFWLAGLDDPFAGTPDPELAIPESIRNLPHEPVVLLCHAPDYVDDLLTSPAGRAVSLVLAGHTHGGQIRPPLIRPLILPPLGRKYVEGWFRFGSLQLYVNRGLGTVGVPIRFNCPPEITLLTLRAA